MTPDPVLVSLAKEKAAEHGLDPILVCAVIEQESGWNPWAWRFESGFLSRYVAPLYHTGIVKEPGELYARSYSWGLMQIMGQVAREMGFLGPYMPELCKPDIGIEYGCKKLVAVLEKAKGDVRAALLAWNGGANGNYPNEVLARMVRYAEVPILSASVSTPADAPAGGEKPAT